MAPNDKVFSGAAIITMTSYPLLLYIAKAKEHLKPESRSIRKIRVHCYWERRAPEKNSKEERKRNTNGVHATHKILGRPN
jgi:hypothetical protein